MSYSPKRPVFTVFTPTYNRAKLLTRLYDSLKRQSWQDFEWIILDDGSADETKDIVSNWKKEVSFPIRYFWQENKGKHIAINRGVEMARGDFFAIMDSDDWYVDNALERFLYHWRAIPEKNKSRYAGVCGLFRYENGSIVGSRFPRDILDTDDLSLRFRYRVTGDKIGFTRTSIMRKFPFPEDLGKFVTESLVWNRIGRQYITRFVNEVFAIKEYQKGGLTHKGRALQAKYSKASRLYNYELLISGCKLPFSILIKAYSNYIRHSIHQNVPVRFQLDEIPSKFFWLLCYPIGCVLAMRDNKIVRKLQR